MDDFLTIHIEKEAIGPEMVVNILIYPSLIRRWTWCLDGWVRASWSLGITPKLRVLVWLGMAGTARLEGDRFVEGDRFLEGDGFLEWDGFLERDWFRLGCGASRQWVRLSRPLTCRA